VSPIECAGAETATLSSSLYCSVSRYNDSCNTPRVLPYNAIPRGAATTWVVLANTTWKLKHFVFLGHLFALFSGSWRVSRHGCAFWGHYMRLLKGQFINKTQNGAWTRIFKLNSQNIKTCIYIGWQWRNFFTPIYASCSDWPPWCRAKKCKHLQHLDRRSDTSIKLFLNGPIQF